MKFNFKLVKEGLINPDGFSNQDHYLDSIKADLEEWDTSFREANAVYKKVTELQKLHEQYLAGQVVLNSDDNVHVDLQKMIDSKGDGTAKHLAGVVKKAKTDRDFNRTGTTKLRLEMTRAQAATKDTKKKTILVQFWWSSSRTTNKT